MITKYVPVPKSPFVVTYGGSNTLREPVIARIRFRTMIVLILGNVTYLNFWKALAPSISAASYMEESTDMIAPIKSTIF